MFKRLLKSYTKPFYKNSYYLIANYIIGSVLGFVFWIIAAKFYNTSDVGMAVLLISTSTILTNISILGLDVSVVKFLATEVEKVSFVNMCITIISFVALLTSILFILGINIWAPKLIYLKNSILFIILFTSFTIGYALFMFLNNVFVALRDTKYSFAQNTLLSILKIPLIIVLTSFSALGLFGSWGFSVIIAIFVGLLFSLKQLLPEYSIYPVFKKNTLIKIMKFSTGNYLVNISSTVPILLIPIIISNFLPPEQNAYFYIAYTIASILFIIPQAFSLSLFAEGSFNWNNFFPNLKKAVKLVYPILILGVLFSLLFGYNVLLIFGEDYATGGYYLLCLLSISSIFLGINSFFNTYLKIKSQLRKLLSLNILMAFIILILSYMSIPKMGIIGFGYSFLISQIVISFYVVIIVFKNKNM